MKKLLDNILNVRYIAINIKLIKEVIKNGNRINSGKRAA